MPLLGSSKKKNESKDVAPWEKMPGYWSTPHGRLAMERKGARHIAKMHPEAVYLAQRMHAAEQYAAATGHPAPRPHSPFIMPYPNRPEFNLDARKFAEAHPDIVNHYARCEGRCGDGATRDAGRVCDRCLSDDTPSSTRAYHHPGHHTAPTLAPHHDLPYGASHPADYRPRPLCDTCRPAYPHPHIDRWESHIPPYKGPLTGMPGRDGLLHHENCLQAQPELYCRCHDCEDRREGFVGSLDGDGSYVRERPRDWEREI